MLLATSALAGLSRLGRWGSGCAGSSCGRDCKIAVFTLCTGGQAGKLHSWQVFQACLSRIQWLHQYPRSLPSPARMLQSLHADAPCRRPSRRPEVGHCKAWWCAADVRLGFGMKAVG